MSAYVMIKLPSFFRSSRVVRDDGCNFILSNVEEHWDWSILAALLSIAVGPWVSCPWAGDTVPSDKVVPASRPSGVAPIIDPPANIDDIDAPPIPLILPRMGPRGERGFASSSMIN